MRVLITGVTGMAGSHLADYLLQKEGLEVYGTFRWRSRMENLDDLKREGKLNIVACGCRPARLPVDDNDIPVFFPVGKIYLHVYLVAIELKTLEFLYGQPPGRIHTLYFTEYIGIKEIYNALLNLLPQRLPLRVGYI